MKTLLYISSSHSRYIYHNRTGKFPEVRQGTVGAEQRDSEDAAKIWDKLNEQAGNGMAEVRAAVLEKVENPHPINQMVSHAWKHKRR